MAEMSDEYANREDGARRAILTIQAALNTLIREGTLTKRDILDSINDVFSPPNGEAPTVIIEHPSDAHAILSEFVSGLQADAQQGFTPTMEI